jgi:tricorn protease
MRTLTFAAMLVGATALSPTAALAQSETSKPSLAEPSLSPDGSQIAFASGGDIWEVASSGGVAHLLATDPATEARPLYSPDGKRLAFTSNRSGNTNIYVLDLASGRVERITYAEAGEELDAWSPFEPAGPGRARRHIPGRVARGYTDAG